MTLVLRATRDSVGLGRQTAASWSRLGLGLGPCLGVRVELAGWAGPETASMLSSQARLQVQPDPREDSPASS